MTLLLNFILSEDDSEWVCKFLASGKKKLHFDEMMTKYPLYLINIIIGLVGYYIVQATCNWNNSPHVDMSLNGDTLSWTIHSLLLLLIAICLEEKQQVPL
jgi:hypothetical protein